MAEVRAGSRIHMGLADMGFVSPRAFGGVGFIIDQPQTRLTAYPCKQLELVGFGSLDPRARDECERLCRKVLASGQGVRVTLESAPPQHVGLGSKTALKLSILAALDAEFGLQLSRAQMQELSGRGGASGIGIHGFFEGGVIWDVGHPRRAVQTLAPSSAGPRPEPPLLMLRLGFPSQWLVGLILSDCAPISGTKEIGFFHDEAPVPAQEALETLALLYHGVLPAFRTADLHSMADTLSKLQLVGFKAREVRLRGDAVQRLLRELEKAGYAAGMSSLGGLVYVLCDDLMKEAELAEMANRHEGRWLGWAHGMNEGAQVSGATL